MKEQKRWGWAEVQIWTYEKGTKKMGNGHSADLKLYENKRIEAENIRF